MREWSKHFAGAAWLWMQKVFWAFCQSLYNFTYLVGIQSLRVLKRSFSRVRRFLRPLRNLCQRLYKRFLRRRVRFLHFAVIQIMIMKNLRWESWHIRKARQEHGFKKALSHIRSANQLRAVLSFAGQIALPCLALLFLAGTIWFWNQQSFGLYLDYGGDQVVAVEDEGVFDTASEMMNQRMLYDTAVEADTQINAVYQLGIVQPDYFESATVICDRLIQQSDDVINEASGLYVNGELIGVVRSSTDLRYTMESVLDSQQTEMEGDSAEFLENVEIITGLFPTARIVAPDQLKDMLSSQLHVKVTRKETYEETVPYKTVTKKDDSQYTDYSKVTQEGKDGVRTCVDKVSYVGGKEVSREKISREVTQEPVNKVVVVGTKKRPTGKIPGEASGKFTWPSPVVRYISSYYGARWGTTHWGLDFSNGNSYGQTIVAADGGTVSYVKLHNYGYGYHLLIDHGNGYQTMYAHASKILVTSGQKVAKGQPIALIGSTGDSTGAHLHFEIIKYGSKVDPLPYLTGG